jgi:hypothetical protein
MNTKQPTVGKRTMGLDLGDRRHHVCVLDDAGKLLAEEAIVNTREVLTAFCARYRGATVVMETGTHSPWVSRLVAAQGHPVIVANARKLRAISQSQTKSDREDAQMLARLGRADPKLLSPVRHRSEATQRALVRLKVREALVRSRVNLVNSVRFLLKSLGVFVSPSIKAMAFARKLPRWWPRCWWRSIPSTPRSNNLTSNWRRSPAKATPRPSGCGRSRASARSPRFASC